MTRAEAETTLLLTEGRIIWLKKRRRKERDAGLPTEETEHSIEVCRTMCKQYRAKIKVMSGFLGERRSRVTT